MASRKVLGKAAKPSLSRKSAATVAKNRSGKPTKTVSKAKAKSLVKSAAKTLTTSDMKRKATNSPGGAASRSVKRNVVKSPGRVSAKSPKKPGRSTAKSPVRKSANSPGRPILKSPVRKSAKSLGRPTAKSPVKSAKSPGRPTAKSPVRTSAKSLGRPITKSVGKSVKSPGRSTAKSPVGKSIKSPRRPIAKSPVRKVAVSPGRPSTKLLARRLGKPMAKVPVKKLTKSRGRPAKLPTKARGRPPDRLFIHLAVVSPVKTQATISRTRTPKSPSTPTQKSPSRSTKVSPGRPAKKPEKSSASHVKVTATMVKKKSPRGRPAIRIPNTVKPSPQKSPVKVSGRRTSNSEVRPLPVRSSITSESPAKKTPIKPTLNAQAVSPIQVSVTGSSKKLMSVSGSHRTVPVDAPPKKPTPTTQILQSASLSPRKRSSLSTTALPSPAKKTKAANVVSPPKLALVSPPRPTRLVSRPARLLEADIQPPKSAVPAGRKELVSKSSPTLKCPLKSAGVVVQAEKRQSRSETRVAETRDVRTTRKSGSVPVGNQSKTLANKSPIKKPTSKVAEHPAAKPTRSGTRSSEPIIDIEQSNKTIKKMHIKEAMGKSAVRDTKDDPQKSPSKPVSPRSVSHPCKHCGLIFKSLSDGELHENRCNKNPKRTDTRYQCNKCSGNFTMSDLILHKKQAHPQRDYRPPDTPQVTPAPAESPASPPPAAEVGTNRKETCKKEPTKANPTAKKSFGSPQVNTPPGGLVLKVPVGGDLNDVIRQAVQAATTAGLILGNKKIVISRQNVMSGVAVTEGNKPKTTSQVAANLKRETSGNKTPSSAKRVRFEKLPARAKDHSHPVQAGSTDISQKAKRVTHVPNEAMQDEDSKSSQPKFFTCLDCGDIFPSRKKVSEHKGECPEVGKTSIYACMDCNTTFIARKELTVHRREQHPVMKSKTKSANMTIRSFKCSECELFFPIESEAKKHITEIHGGVGESSMCNVVATPDALRSGDWNRNISEEMVEEVIKNIVNGARKDQEPNSEGVDKSTGQTGNQTSGNDVLENQNILQHPHMSEEPSTPVINPSYCGERKPGQCLDCFMKVSSRLELAKHKRHCKIALQNRQLFCFVCSSSFRSYFELSRHKQEQHTGYLQDLSCPSCNTFYKTSCEWLEHQNKQHPGSPLRQPPLRQKAAVDSSTQLLRAKPVSKKTPEKPTKELIQAKGGKSESKKSAELVKTQEVRTRSGRVVHKKKLDDEIIIEHVVKPKKVRNIPEPPNPIGTIEIVPQDVDDVIVIEDSTETTVTNKQSEKTQPASKQACSTISPLHIPIEQLNELTANPEDQSSITFANGLVTISAEKATDYQIFVDAKDDGSSIQLKLIRKDNITQRQAGILATPVKPQTNPSKEPVSKQNPTSATMKRDKPRVATTPVVAAAKKTPAVTESTPSPPSKRAKRETTAKPVKTPQEQSSSKADTSRAWVDKAPISGNPPVDTIGKVVQKGKPFVIGGQTLVPIQFPPGFQLPGGATGGQKVFAIPSTNLPPGLLQLLAKQQKATSAAASWSPNPDSPKKIAPKPVEVKRRPGILASSTKSQKNIEIPASLKGMTGAQLMARAQARILGRPLPPLVVEAETIQAASSTAKAHFPAKEASPGTAKGELKKTVAIIPPVAANTMAPIKSGTSDKMTSIQKKAAGKKASAPEATPVKKASARIVAANKKPTVIHIMPQSDVNKPSTYNDPLFVFQCTSCKKNFKSTSDINKHMQACIGVDIISPPMRQRSTRRKTGTDVWHMKPVASAKEREVLDKESDSQNVEWFVASKSR